MLVLLGVEQREIAHIVILMRPSVQMREALTLL